MTTVESYFFELLQVAIGQRDMLSVVPTPEEWEGIYVLSEKHALRGITFRGVENLPREQLPPPRRVRQWALKVEHIKDLNDRITVECVELCKLFHENGFKACVLKGQANIPYYKADGQVRTPGDIDVWVVAPQPAKTGKGIRQIIEFCKKMRKGNFIFYHNLSFPVLKKTPVEVHYRPSWLFNPFRNRRLQRWFDQYRDFHGFPEWQGFLVPSAEFNVIFQLLHIYKHIFESGIGLRQMLDYYYALLAYCEQHAPTDPQLQAQLRAFGLRRFTSAVMYVLHEVFALPRDKMLLPPDRKEGRILLEEILQSGNFGQYDERYDWDVKPVEGTDRMTLAYAWTRLKHNFHLLSSYPDEVLWEPPFRIYHLLWRRLELWKRE